LAELWVQATDRQAITQAANAIEVHLQRHPDTCGESRAGNRRLLIEPPLAVLYTVRAQDRKVTVLDVGRS
jgi:hypothetical protein